MFHIPYSPANAGSRKPLEIVIKVRDMFHDRRGMSLMETVFAIGILLLGLGAAVTLVGTAITTSRQNTDTIVVTNLAREALEVVRSIRDGSQSGQGFASLASGVWILDANTTTFDQSSPTLLPAIPAQGVGTPPAISSCINCNLVVVGGQYRTSANPGGSPTPYARMVEIVNVQAVPPVLQKRIIATVQWIEKGRRHVFTLETELWDWK